MIRVAIVDEHPVVRRGYAYILGEQPDLEIVAAVDDPADLPAAATGAVVIYDWRPFGESARPHVVQHLSVHSRVLVVSHCNEPADVTDAMRAGARGYLSKDSSGPEYLAAVRAVGTGGDYVPHRTARDGTPAPAGRTELSRREQQALTYIARGFTHQQAARRMGVSKATVDTYVSRIRIKLQLGNKAQLALAGLRYLEPDRRQPGPVEPRLA
jgi:DNA-binding NarL/FixJ family response regulator